MTFGEILWALVAAGGGGAVIAISVVRAFGERWLSNKFDARLQSLRHEHERQMETIRLETSRTLDRSSRLTEREFEVAAEAWSLVFDTYVSTASAMPGLRRYPDLSRASDDVARRVAEGSGFDETEIEELLKHELRERNRYYSDRP